MADEKLNTGQEENSQPSLFDAGPEGAPTPEPPAPENTPEQAAGDTPAQDAPAGAPGEVNVSADQIEKLMAERRAAERAEVEKNEPPEPEQPPTPAPEDKPKGRRGRKPKEEKAGPGEPGGTGARRGRQSKAGKAAPDKPPAQPRDKMSQGKGGKAATVKGKEDAPAAPPPAPEQPPQPRDATRAEKEEIPALCTITRWRTSATRPTSLNIQRNSIYGLLGPNGAGKSTILKMITGVLRPTSGSIEFDGHPWSRADLENIGALIEMPPLYENLSAYENLKARTLALGLPESRIKQGRLILSFAFSVFHSLPPFPPAR